MIRTLLFDPTLGALREGGRELVDQWLAIPESLIWVVLEDESPESEANLLLERFGIHRLALTDAQRDRHPPKVEDFGDHTLVILKGLDASSTTVDFNTIQLSMFAGERFLVTRSSGHSLSTEKVLAMARSGELDANIPRAELLLRLVRTVGERFLAILFGLETRLERMETEMLESPNDRLLAELVRQKADLKRLVRVLNYHAQIFASTGGKELTRFAAHRHELNDVAEQMERQLSLARLHLELSEDLIDGYISLSAHHLNQIMKTLTIVTVIFVPITFMAGIYGMNFEFMPELGYRPAYFLLLGTMLVVVASILSFFYWRGWLGGRRSVDREVS